MDYRTIILGVLCAAAGYSIATVYSPSYTAQRLQATNDSLRAELDSLGIRVGADSIRYGSSQDSLRSSLDSSVSVATGLRQSSKLRISAIDLNLANLDSIPDSTYQRIARLIQTENN